MCSLFSYYNKFRKINYKSLQETHTVITIHGLKNSIDEFLMIGGLDTIFGSKLRVALQHNGFIVRESEQAYGGIKILRLVIR